MYAAKCRSWYKAGKEEASRNCLERMPEREAGRSVCLFREKEFEHRRILVPLVLTARLPVDSHSRGTLRTPKILRISCCPGMGLHPLHFFRGPNSTDVRGVNLALLL